MSAFFARVVRQLAHLFGGTQINLLVPLDYCKPIGFWPTVETQPLKKDWQNSMIPSVFFAVMVL
jgi:hypothetical protein